MSRKYQMLFCTIAAGLTLLFVNTSCTKKTEPASAMLPRALEAAVNGKWDEASILAESVLKQQPQNVDALILSALAMEAGGDVESAQTRVARAASLSPQNFMAQYTNGRILYRMNKFEQSRAPLKAAYELKSDDRNVLLLLAKVSAKLNTQDAPIYYKQLLSYPEYRMNPVIYNEMGVIMVRRNQAKKALPLFLAAMKGDPANSGILLNTAIVYDFHLNQKDRASEIYQQYLRQTANHAELDGERFAVTQRLQNIR